jgi:hypothetical protein
MTTPTLLGYLARFGSFSAQSEVLCTQGLTYLLQEYEDARSALAAEVAARTGIVNVNPLTWHAEAVQDDQGRPDLEARTPDEVPAVKIEAKLGAELTANQLQSYQADLQCRNSGETALLVLVPQGRMAETARITAEALGLSGPGPWRVTDGYRTGVAVISWDELFSVLWGVSTGQFRYELEQLQAMYRVLSGDFIAPLASIEELQQWRARETDFRNLVDQVTRRLTTQHRLYPMGSEPIEEVSEEREASGYYRRFVCSCSDGGGSCFSIGARDSFAELVTPIWMRFHRSTGHFWQIHQRFEASALNWLESGGHIWIPLQVPLEVPREQMIEALVEQAQAVERVAYAAI